MKTTLRVITFPTPRAIPAIEDMTPEAKLQELFDTRPRAAEYLEDLLDDLLLDAREGRVGGRTRSKGGR